MSQECGKSSTNISRQSCDVATHVTAIFQLGKLRLREKFTYRPKIKELLRGRILI